MLMGEKYKVSEIKYQELKKVLKSGVQNLTEDVVGQICPSRDDLGNVCRNIVCAEDTEMLSALIDLPEKPYVSEKILKDLLNTSIWINKSKSFNHLLASKNVDAQNWVTVENLWTAVSTTNWEIIRPLVKLAPIAVHQKECALLNRAFRTKKKENIECVLAYFDENDQSDIKCLLDLRYPHEIDHGFLYFSEKKQEKIMTILKTKHHALGLKDFPMISAAIQKKALKDCISRSPTRSTVFTPSLPSRKL